MKLKGYSRKTNKSSIKDELERVKVKEISLKIYNMDHKIEVEVEAYILPKRHFNMPAQSLHTNGENQNILDHLQKY